MARIGINTGSVADDNTGSTLRAAGGIINNNFLEIYNHLGDGTNLTGIVTSIIAGTNVTVSGSTGQVTINASGGGEWVTTDVGIHTLSNVGIGTTNPTSKLHVVGVVSATSFSGSGSGLTNIPSGQLTGALPVLDGSALTGIVTSIIAGTNVTVSGSTGQVTINASGGGGSSQWVTTDVGIHTLSNVGIGTTNPTSKLHVVGVVSATSFSGSGSGLTNIPSGQLTGALPVLDGSALTGIVASGSGIIIKDSGSTVGTAGTIDFGDNLTVSAISAGIVTVTGSAGGGGGSSQFVTTATGIHTLSNVGIGTTNPTSKLQVERYGVSTGFGTFSATAGIATDIDTFAISSIDFKTVEYTLHFTNDSNIQAQKVLVMQNGTTSYSQEYGIMFEPNRILSIGAIFSSGVCKLQATPESGISGLVIYRIIRQGLL